MDLVKKLFEVTEHRARLYVYRPTGEVVAAPLPDAVTRRFGEKLLATIKHLFRTWHRRNQMPAERWKREADQAKRGVLKVARRPPWRSEAQNIAERFRQHAEHYFRFLETPGVEPTNNAMEQRFRFVVIDRKITQGTRGETGRRWCERIWTVLATLHPSSLRVEACLPKMPCRPPKHLRTQCQG